MKGASGRGTQDHYPLDMCLVGFMSECCKGTEGLSRPVLSLCSADPICLGRKCSFPPQPMCPAIALQG